MKPEILEGLLRIGRFDTRKRLARVDAELDSSGRITLRTAAPQREIAPLAAVQGDVFSHLVFIQQNPAHKNDAIEHELCTTTLRALKEEVARADVFWASLSKRERRVLLKSACYALSLEEMCEADLHYYVLAALSSLFGFSDADLERVHQVKIIQFHVGNRLLDTLQDAPSISMMLDYKRLTMANSALDACANSEMWKRVRARASEATRNYDENSGDESTTTELECELLDTARVLVRDGRPFSKEGDYDTLVGWLVIRKSIMDVVVERLIGASEHHGALTAVAQQQAAQAAVLSQQHAAPSRRAPRRRNKKSKHVAVARPLNGSIVVDELDSIACRAATAPPPYRTCLVCGEPERDCDVVMLPCRHVAACASCLDKLDESNAPCPCCNEAVAQRMEIKLI